MRKSKQIHCEQCALRRGAAMVPVKEESPKPVQINILDGLADATREVVSFTRARVNDLRNNISSFMKDLKDISKIISPSQIQEAVKNSQEYVRAFELSLLMSYDRYQDCKEAHEKSTMLPYEERLAIQASYLKAEKEYLDLKYEWDRGNQGFQELADSLPPLDAINQKYLLANALKIIPVTHNLEETYLKKYEAVKQRVSNHRRFNE